MCRLLCYMGYAIPMDLLITKPEHSLVFQSRDASFHPGCPDKRNIRVNGDGFGVAWYNPKKIPEGACVVKFPTPAWSSANLLNIAKFVESGLVFAHVRAASDGSALVGNVNHENTHPFKYKRYTFMHNGGIPGFDKMKRQLLSLVGDEAYEAIDGTTDSEVCFAFFLDELPNTDDQLDAAEMAQVLRRTIARIVSAVVRFAEPHPRDGETANSQDNATAAAAVAAATTAAAEPSSSLPLPPANNSDGSAPTVAAAAAAAADAAAAAAAATTNAPPMSLNFCVTDGRHIVCSRYRNHPRQVPPSLFVLSGAGFACDEEGSCLRFTAPEPHTSVVISSEPLCRSTKGWRLLARNSMVVIEGSPPTVASPNAQTNDSNGPLRLGLVASIKYEPLRCHPSDAPVLVGNGVGNGIGKGIGNGIINGSGNGIGNCVGTGIGNGIGNGVSNDVGNGTSNGIGSGIGNDIGSGIGNGNGVGNGIGNGGHIGNGVGNGIGNSSHIGNGVGNGIGIGNGVGTGNCTGKSPTGTALQGPTPGGSASCGVISPDVQQGRGVSLDGTGSTAAPCSSIAVAVTQVG